MATQVQVSQSSKLLITTAWLQPWYPLKTQQICFAVMRSILQWPIKKFQTVYWKVLLSLSLQLQIWHKITTKLVGSELRKALSDLLLTSNRRPHWKNKLVILTMEWLSWLQPIEETGWGIEVYFSIRDYNCTRQPKRQLPWSSYNP